MLNVLVAEPRPGHRTLSVIFRQLSATAFIKGLFLTQQLAETIIGLADTYNAVRCSLRYADNSHKERTFMLRAIKQPILFLSITKGILLIVLILSKLR